MQTKKIQPNNGFFFSKRRVHFIIIDVNAALFNNTIITVCNVIPFHEES